MSGEEDVHAALVAEHAAAPAAPVEHGPRSGHLCGLGLAGLEGRAAEGHVRAVDQRRTQEATLSQFSARGPEQAKMAAKDLHRIANSRKAGVGRSVST